MLLSPPISSSLGAAYTIASGEPFAPEKDFTLYDRGSGACEDRSEGGDSAAVFVFEEGATLSNVIIGANQAEGIHCLDYCTLYNVWFEDVGEDSITIKQVTFVVLPWVAAADESRDTQSIYEPTSFEPASSIVPFSRSNGYLQS
ncbi:hypothetical protein ACEPAI_3214 [Sanghuangporus weigelae]